MPNAPLPSKPPSPQDSLLRNKLSEDIAGQAQRMDSLAQQLITIELAIPGLYATALKLVRGDAATLTGQGSLYLAFGLWFLALLLTLAALFPRRYRIDQTLLRRDRPARPGEALSIEEYFSRSASDKRWLLVAASLSFFTGLSAAAFGIL
jgi:hypothetical protein